MCDFADVLLASVTCGIGLSVCLRGYVMVQNPTRAPLAPLSRLGVELMRRTLGADAARRRESELARPERIRRSGQNALAVGGLLLLGGVVQLAACAAEALGLL